MDQEQAMHFTKQEIAARLHEFKGLPVRLEHTNYLLGKVGHAHQAKQGSLFVRLDFQPIDIEAQSAVDAIKRGDIRGVSVNHNPLTKQLTEVSATKIPGREGCYMLPESATVQFRQSDPTQACFSYFDSLEYNGQASSTDTMAEPVEAPKPNEAKPVEAPKTNVAKPVEAPKTNEAKPVETRETKPSDDNELTTEKAEAIAKAAKAIEEENKRMKAELEQLRKKTEPLEKERAEKVAAFVSTLFGKVVRETPEQKAKADAAQRRLAEAVLQDETLAEVVLSAGKTSNNNVAVDPRDEQVRKSVKRPMGPETRALLEMTRESKHDEKTGEFRQLRKSPLDPVLQGILDSAFSLQAAAPQAAFSNTSEKDREIVEKFTENYRQQSMTGAPPITFEPQFFGSFQAFSNR